WFRAGSGTAGRPGAPSGAPDPPHREHPGPERRVGSFAMERRRTTPAGPAGRRPGRPATVTRAALTDAVLRLGFPGLTVSAAARELGVRHASLYRHVTGREHLIALALDRIIAGAPWPEPTGGWRTYLAAPAGSRVGPLGTRPGPPAATAA